MPILLSRSKHKEFESNSALQIRDQKERIVENTKKMEHSKNFARLQNFPTYEILQVAKFASYTHCSPHATIHLSSHYSFLLTVASFLVFLPFYPL